MKRVENAQQENRALYEVTNYMVRSVHEVSRYIKIHIRYNSITL